MSGEIIALSEGYYRGYLVLYSGHGEWGGYQGCHRWFSGSCAAEVRRLIDEALDDNPVG